MEIWRPTSERIDGSHLRAYVELLGQEYGWRGGSISHDPRENGELFRALHAWSVEHPETFWRSVWKYAGLIGELGNAADNGADQIWKKRFFPKGTLNFAENALRQADTPLAQRWGLTQRSGQAQHSGGTPNHEPLAIIALDETGRRTEISRQKLREDVYRFARRLQSIGVKPGDRIAAVMPNSIESVVGFLAASAIGAIWTCCSPEFGDEAIVDRFAQTAPKVLMHALESRYNGKRFCQKDRIGRLEGRLPSVEHVILVAGDMQSATPSREWRTSRLETHWWDDIATSESCAPIEFERFPFDHPLYILYSSGTTGAPKCIVHSAGGALIQHAKEHQIGRAHV